MIHYCPKCGYFTGPQHSDEKQRFAGEDHPTQTALDAKEILPNWFLIENDFQYGLYGSFGTPQGANFPFLLHKGEFDDSHYGSIPDNLILSMEELTALYASCMELGKQK